MDEKKIAFVGQGFVGKSYADDLEERGISVIRYALEEPYLANKSLVCEADIVFLCLPAPTTKKGFDTSIIESNIPLCKKGASIIIKSTMYPGSTELIQKKFPEYFIFHSPEFLTARIAKEDAKNPTRNIIGYTIDNEEHKSRAREAMSFLPKAPYHLICPVKEAELIKYAGNCFGYTKVIYFNILYEIANNLGVDWETIREATAKDPRIGEEWTKTPHIGSGTINGRGAGGACFIKDFAAFQKLAKEELDDEDSLSVLKSIEKKNLELLKESQKDQDLVTGVYG